MSDSVDSFMQVLCLALQDSREDIRQDPEPWDVDVVKINGTFTVKRLEQALTAWKASQ